jgi:hypothetical protein
MELTASQKFDIERFRRTKGQHSKADLLELIKQARRLMTVRQKLLDDAIKASERSSVSFVIDISLCPTKEFKLVTDSLDDEKYDKDELFDCLIRIMEQTMRINNEFIEVGKKQFTR